MRDLSEIPPPRHGTSYVYQTYGCRCRACTDAMLATNRPSKDRRRGQEPPEHGRTGYVDYHCRCKVCTAAAMAAHREWMDEVAVSLPAPRRYAPWTGPELEIIARDDLSITEMARLCGRTYGATSRARRKIRGEPPKVSRDGRAGST